MSEYVFLFDLDATITKVEILPQIAKAINKEEEMRALTELTMQGEIPFEQSFLERIELLKDIPVDEVADMVRDIPVNDMIVDFIRENADRCYVVTGNLDVWISKLMDKIGMSGHCLCSEAMVNDNKISKVKKVIDKSQAIANLDKPFVAIGDGNNDAEMIAAAEVGIGFGGVRDIAPAVMQSATHATYSEERLCQFLRQLL